MSTNMYDSSQPDYGEDLGAKESETGLDPLTGEQKRQPRPDELDPDEPVGAPVDPLEQDPSRVQGDRAEDDM